jgi:hypothetical protein
MFLTYRRVSRISVVPALAMVASVAILIAVAAIMALVVVAACGAAFLRAIGAVRSATPSVPFPDHATIEGVAAHSSERI